MSADPADLGSTNVRVTFRTFKVYVRKLRAIARARRLSLSQVLNMIVGEYDDSKTKKKKGPAQ